MVPRAAWLLLAFAIAGGSYGWFLNDEADQAAALYSLSNGSLHVEGQSPRTYALAENISWERRWGNIPVASTALNVLALPVIPALILLDALAPLSMWFGALFTASAWRALGLQWPIRSSSRLGRWIAAGSMLALFLLTQAGFASSGPDVRYYYPVIALQITNLLIASACAWALWKLSVPHIDSSVGRGVALLGTVSASWLFWAKGLKYHMLGAAVIACLLLVLRGSRHPRQLAVVGLLVGFAAWVNPGIGLVALVALGCTEVARTLTTRPTVTATLRQWMVIGIGGVIGAAPMLIENHFLFGNPFTGFYLAPDALDTTENQTSAPSDTMGFDLIGVTQNLLQWQGWQDFSLDLVSTLTLGNRLQGTPFGIFFLTPLLAFSVFGTVQTLRRPWRYEQVFAVALITSQAALLTNAGMRQGAGLDPRLWFHIMPAFALLSYVGARPLLGSLPSHYGKKITIVVTSFLVLGYAALIALSQAHLRLGPTLGRHFYLSVLALWVAAAFLTAFAWTLVLLRPRSRQAALVVSVAMILAVPLVWSVMFLWIQHTEIPRTGPHEGGEMFLPLMNELAPWLRDAIDPPTGIGRVFDGNGTLVYHPDHGSCLVDPNPCPDVPMPEDLRRRLEALHNETAEA